MGRPAPTATAGPSAASTSLAARPVGGRVAREVGTVWPPVPRVDPRPVQLGPPQRRPAVDVRAAPFVRRSGPCCRRRPRGGRHRGLLVVAPALAPPVAHAGV